MRVQRWACALLAAAALAAAPSLADDILGVGVSSPGSVFHSAGAAMAMVASEHGDLPMTVQAFASPTVYLPAVETGQIAFGVSNIGDVRLSAVGEMYFDGRKLDDLRVVAVMFPLPMAIYVADDSPIQTIDDLRGVRMPTGFAGQKTLRPLFEAMLAADGLTTSDVDPVQVPDVVGGANAFIEGKADAFFLAIGAAKVREAEAAVGGLRALSLPNTPEALAALQAVWPVGYLIAVPPGPANPGVDTPIHTIAHDAVVVASTHVSDDEVYAFVKSLHDNPDALRAAFAAFNRFDPERMMVEIPDVQWHPGALRYYREIGLAAAAETPSGAE